MQVEEQLTKKTKGHNKISIPSLPCREESLRNKDAIVELTTNLLKLQISQNNKKLCLYSVALEPELDRNNYSLYANIQRQIDVESKFTRVRKKKTC